MTISKQVLSFLALMCMASLASSDFAADRAECTNQLMGLATCITYVQGTAKAPTPDCCTGFDKVVGKGLKCLCILVQDRNEPQLGIKFNVSLALELPKKCDVPANVSDCPRLLKLPKDSQETKMFDQFAKEMNDSPSASTSSPVNGTPSTTMATTTGKGTQSNTGVKSKKWIGSSCIFPLFFFLLV
ncbi:hypothetical protein LUZ60_010502 [Juncus effusus]|nr:hypothetical protein LUZ60_010502 [Juncus effusus]